MLNRILDAFYCLIVGHTRTESRCRALELDLLNMLEKLNAWSARQAKRESREAAKNLSEQLDLPVATTPQDRKAELRRRAFGFHSRQTSPFIGVTYEPSPEPSERETA